MEVREAGVETPPPSPPPMLNLFPEQRVAVYRIAKESAAARAAGGGGAGNDEGFRLVPRDLN